MLRIRVFVAGLLVLAGCDGQVEAPAFATSEDEVTGGIATTLVPEIGRIHLSGNWCTATLVAPRVVLTAKHCIGNRTGSISGTFEMGDGSSYGLTWASSYPDGSTPGSRDLALIQLARRANGTPLAVSSRAPSRGAQVAVVGYGCNDGWGSGGSGTKRYAMIWWGHDSSVLCQGDSGGPVIDVPSMQVVAVNSGRSWGNDVFALPFENDAWFRSQLATLNIPPVLPHDGSGTYEGCFADNPNDRALPAAQGNGWSYLDLTPAACRDACRSQGYPYAGVQYGGQCFCGTQARHQRVSDTECDVACTGNPLVACGGFWRNSIYATGASGSPQPGGPYRGCFADGEPRALSVHAYSRPDNTPALCRAECAARGHRYAGVQWYDECFCGDSLGFSQQPENECNTPCSGDGSQMCGGGWRNSIYDAR